MTTTTLTDLEPRSEECLYCFLLRVLHTEPCRGDHRWTQAWADARPAAAWVLRWVQAHGGCCCDCEVVFNALGLEQLPPRQAPLRCEDSRADELAEEARLDRAEYADDGDDDDWLDGDQPALPGQPWWSGGR